MENSYLASDAVDDDPMTPLLGHSITYRIAVGSQAGRKVFTLQTLPTSGDPFGDGIGKVAGPACTPAWRPGPMNARSSNGCAGTSAARRYPRSGCR